MSRNLLTGSPTAPILEAASYMGLVENFRRIPVIDQLDPCFAFYNFSAQHRVEQSSRLTGELTGKEPC